MKFLQVVGKRCFHQSTRLMIGRRGVRPQKEEKERKFSNDFASAEEFYESKGGFEGMHSFWRNLAIDEAESHECDEENADLLGEMLKDMPDISEHTDVGEVIGQISNLPNLSFAFWRECVEAVLKSSKHIKGPAWLGIDRPFIANGYQATPPPSNHLKNEIYKMFKVNGKYWSAGRLAEKFNISLDRVKAIIKLKELEELYVSRGFDLESNQRFAKKMDFILMAKGNFTEKDFIEDPITNSPKFIALKEPVLTPEDSARALRKKFISKVAVKPKSKDLDPSELFIRKDVYEANDNHRSVFIDVGYRSFDSEEHWEPLERKILVREKDGSLRHAKLSERHNYGQQLWDKDYLKFV